MKRGTRSQLNADWLFYVLGLKLTFVAAFANFAFQPSIIFVFCGCFGLFTALVSAAGIVSWQQVPKKDK